MATVTPSAVNVLTTLTLMKSGGTATLSLVRQGDGAVKFTDADGNVQIVRHPQMSLLFDAFNALA